MKILLAVLLGIAPLSAQVVASTDYSVGATSVSIPNISSRILGYVCLDSTGAQIFGSFPTSANPSVIFFSPAVANAGVCTIFGAGGSSGGGGGGTGVPGPTAVDWVSQIKNKPFVEVRSYNFTAQRPGGTLTASSPASVRLNPCPPGVSGTDTNHYLRVVGGTGTAEAVLITGGSCASGISSGTVSFTPANSHSGAWTVTSASSGIQEAILSSTNGSTIYMTTGTYPVYATIYVDRTIVFQGASMSGTVIQGQTPSAGLFNAVVNSTWKDMHLTSASHQTTGAYGVKLDALGSASNSFSAFDHVLLSNLWDGILGVNASQFTVTSSFFLNFWHTGITTGDANSPDAGGPTITGSNFFNYAVSPTASAAFQINSTGDITFANNGVNGSANQINTGVSLAATVSSGLLIDNNDFENLGFSGVHIAGTFELININNNHFSQFGGIGNPNSYWGVLTEDGAGTGVSFGTISGNVMLGIGPSSSNNGIAIQGHSNQWTIDGNFMNGFGQGVFVQDTTSLITVGHHSIANGGSDLVGFGSATFVLSSPVAFSKMGAWKDGSIIFCTDCTSDCSAGSSNGQFCKRINGAWTN